MNFAFHMRLDKSGRGYLAVDEYRFASDSRTCTRERFRDAVGQNATAPLGRREKIGLAGFEVDRKRYVFLHDQPFPLDFAEYVGDAHHCV
jgi:hypothetical protein